MNNKNNENKKFYFKHSLGQNFLKDTDLLRGIVSDASVSENDNVLEIGAGAGALTKEICNTTKGKVVAVELDRTLAPILNKNLGEFKNLKIVFEDILKVDTKDIGSWFHNEPFRVVANLPYYITTPIIFYLLESTLDIKSITIMIQQEVADRIVAKLGTKDYGAITPILQLYGTSTITRSVNKKMFMPVPKVDSKVLNIDIHKRTDVDITKISKCIKLCFAMRRKTLVNNLMQGYSLTREQAETICKNSGLNIQTRAERLSLDDFIKLNKVLNQ